MYGLTERDQRIRDTARAFVETLMPHEVEAELAGGILPKELTAEHQARAIELGLYATNMPASVGGPGCTALQQVLVQEQCGRVTNGLGWVMATPPQWWVEVATDYQRERWLLPSVRGEKHEAYAITEEFAGSDVSALKATAQRDGDEYVINGVKWHVTSFNLADYVFVEAVVGGGDHVLLVVDLPWPGVEVVRTPQYSHNIADEHPIVAFNDVRVPAANLVGAEGQGMTFTQDWFRFERLMVAARCVGAAQRLVDEVTAFARTAWSTASPRRASTGGGHAGRQRHGTVRRPHDALRGGPLDRRGHRPQDAARPGLDGQAVLLGDGGQGGRPRGADLRRPRLHARERRRADVPRAARRANLGGRQRDSAHHCRPSADDARSCGVA